MTPDTPKPRAARAIVWIVLVLVALAGALYWWDLGRPVDLPDAPSGRIACVSYAPFRMSGETPFDLNAYVSPERIDADLSALSTRFDCVRTYSMGQGLAAVPEIARRHGMKVLMGIWLSRDLAANERDMKLAIATLKKDTSNVRGIVVGNEVLLRGELTTAALVAYIDRIRAVTSVPVTYADVWEFWLRYPDIAKSISYVTVHILPFWEDEPVAPERAVRHLVDVYAQMKAAFPGKEVMIGETGWPSAGRTRREASASIVNEARYLREFLVYAATVHMPYNVIETFDQPWKRDLEGTVGGYWGIFDVNAKPKFPMQGPVIEDAQWMQGVYAGGVGVLVFAAFGGWRRRWRGVGGWLALALTGFASGAAFATHLRLLEHACRNVLEWTIGLGIGALALLTALHLARAIAARLAGGEDAARAAVGLDGRASSRQIGPRWPDAFTAQRFFWLFAIGLYGLLLVFNGRYRDFPVGLFALPCIGFAILGILRDRADALMPLVEERLLACGLPLLGAIVVVQEAGLNPVAWLWAGLNLCIAAPVLVAWHRAGGLQADEA